MWQDLLKAWETKYTREQKREQGSIWTPQELSDWMSEWLLESEPKTVLDPAGGGGNLLARFEDKELVSADIDQDLLEVMSARYPGIKLYDDYWSMPEQTFDAIIANPPYISHRFVENKKEIHKTLSEYYHIDFPLSSNLAILFYLDCWRRLRKGGRMVFLIPTEFMQIRSGQRFKEFLTAGDLPGGQVEHIVDLESTGLFGDEVLSTACLVLAEKTDSPDDEILFSTHSGRAPFPSWSKQKDGAKKVARAEVDHSARWQSSKTVAYSGETQKLGDILEIQPGHITGSNSHFILSYPEVLRLGLEDSAVYCLIRPQQLPTEFFHTEEQIEQIKRTDQKRFLIVIGDQPNEKEREYLDTLEAEDVHKRTTYRNRSPWWRQDFYKGYDFIIPNFRRNRYNLLAYLRDEEMGATPYPAIPNMARVRDAFRDDKEVVFMWLASEGGQKALRSNERDAANGLYTIRSGAIKDVDIPMIQNFPEAWKQEMRRLYESLKTAVLEDEDYSEIMKSADLVSNRSG